MEFEMYQEGLLCISVCTSLSIEEAIARANHEQSTGIRTEWALAEDRKFQDGELNGCDCPDHPGNKHYLLVC